MGEIQSKPRNYTRPGSRTHFSPTPSSRPVPRATRTPQEPATWYHIVISDLPAVPSSETQNVLSTLRYRLASDQTGIPSGSDSVTMTKMTMLPCFATKFAHTYTLHNNGLFVSGKESPYQGSLVIHPHDAKTIFDHIQKKHGHHSPTGFILHPSPYYETEQDRHPSGPVCLQWKNEWIQDESLVKILDALVEQLMNQSQPGLPLLPSSVTPDSGAEHSMRHHGYQMPIVGMSRRVGGATLPKMSRLFCTLTGGQQKQDNNGENVIISPFNIEQALLMTSYGMDGTPSEEIAQEFRQSLGYDPDDAKTEFLDKITRIASSSPSSEKKSQQPVSKRQNGKDRGLKEIVSIAASLWVRMDMVPPTGALKVKNFAQLLRTYFKAQMFPLSTADEVNQWVSDSTRGKIQSIIDQVNPSMRMIIIAAIYFYSDWTYPFDANLTKKSVFRPFASGPQSVSMMRHRKPEHLDYYRSDGLNYQAVVMPYGGGDAKKFEAWIILPDDILSPDSPLWCSIVMDATKDPKEFRSRLSPPPSGQAVELFLPKFKIEYEAKLLGPLSSLEHSGSGSESSNFYDQPVLFPSWEITDIIHKTFIDVTEKGTEAAAVTAVITRQMAMPPPAAPVEFRVDHPFLFVIYSRETQDILFLGRIQKIPQA